MATAPTGLREIQVNPREKTKYCIIEMSWAIYFIALWAYSAAASRVAIVGGGVGAAAAALHLRDLVQEGLQIDV